MQEARCAWSNLVGGSSRRQLRRQKNFINMAYLIMDKLDLRLSTGNDENLF